MRENIAAKGTPYPHQGRGIGGQGTICSSANQGVESIDVARLLHMPG